MTLRIDQPFQSLDRLSLPLSEFVSGRIGYPHEAFLAFDYESLADLPPETDAVVLVSKRNRASAIADLGKLSGRFVVVFAPGDAPLRDSYLGGAAQLPANVAAAYATSNLLDDRRVVSVPLGIRPSNLPAARFVRRALAGQPRRLALANFTANSSHYREDQSGQPHIRQRVLEHHAESPWLDVDVASAQRPGDEALLAYYAQVARHRFVLSPEGNGIDCYRHWESLYLGAIPIVQRSAAMSAFEDLPILFTDDYSELDAEYLEARHDEFSRRTFDLSPLLMSTYRQHFLRAVGALRNPRFVLLDPEGAWSDRLRRTLNRPPRPFGVELAVAEPPFHRTDALRAPGAWRLDGCLEATPEEGPGAPGLTFKRSSVAADASRSADAPGPADARGSAALRLNVMPGATFGVRGSATASGGPLTLRIQDRAGEVLASADVPEGASTPFALEFRTASPIDLHLSPAVTGAATLHALLVEPRL